MALSAGSRFGPYEVLSPIGAGGMGEVYRAQDSRLKRFVAVKVLSAASGGSDDYRRRFIQECRAASALNHPNIITIYDVVSQDGVDVMVMEFVTGQTLDELIPKTGLPVASVLSYGVQMADALSAAHAAGIIHRDLKPGNVMVTSSGLVKILDFGLAKLTGGPALSDPTADTLPLSGPMTVEGSIVGTVSYMSPEQAEGRSVDARSDVFSFGLTLYEMLTGQRAFSDTSNIATLSMILRDEAKPISGIVQGVPPELEQVIGRALRKDPKERWQSMAQMQTELVGLKQRFESRTLTAVPTRSGAKTRVSLLVGAGIVLAGLAAGGWWWTHRVKPAAAPAQTASLPQTAAPAPAAPAAPPAPSAADDSLMTNQSVLDMLQAKVAVSVIISQIRSSPTKFDLTTAEIIKLTRNGATAEVLDAMRNPRAPSSASAKPAAPPAVTPPSTAPEPSRAAANATSRAVPIFGGIPLSVTLTEDVPLNPPAGQAVHFVVAKDFMVKDAVIVAKGTPVDGEIVDVAGSKILGIKKVKPTFHVTTVAATDGSKLAIRATPGRRTDRVNAPIEPPGRHDKDKLAAAGSEYLVYIDGDQAVTVKQ